MPGILFYTGLANGNDFKFVLVTKVLSIQLELHIQQNRPVKRWKIIYFKSYWEGTKQPPPKIFISVKRLQSMEENKIKYKITCIPPKITCVDNFKVKIYLF